MSRPKLPPKPKFPITIETFNNPSYVLEGLAEHKGPSCLNGEISLFRYRVTAEVIPEPIEVLQERLRQIWRWTRNHHHRDPLAAMAKKMGITLDENEYGIDLKEKR